MSERRTIAAAVVVSLALHAGLATVLRGLGLGPPGTVEEPPPLVLDLVEPIMAVSRAERPPAPARSPVPGRAPSRRDPASPSTATRSEAPAAAGPDGPPIPVPPSPPPPPPVAAEALRPVPPLAPPPAAGRAEPGGSRVAEPEPSPTTSRLPGADEGRRTDPGASGGSGALLAGGAESEGRTPTDGAGAAAGGQSAGGGSDIAALPSGRGTAVPPEYDAYVRAFRRRIEERLRYPSLAVRQGLHGTVELEVQVDSGGRLAGVTVVGREPPRMLREAAIQAVRDATPFPLPPALQTRALTIRLPVVFELR